MNPTTRDDLQKVTIIFEDITSSLLLSFMNTATGTQFKKKQQLNISMMTASDRDMGNIGYGWWREIQRGWSHGGHGRGQPYHDGKNICSNGRETYRGAMEEVAVKANTKKIRTINQVKNSQLHTDSRHRAMLRSDRDSTKQQNANRETGAINIEHNPSVFPHQVLCHCHDHPLLGISFH